MGLREYKAKRNFSRTAEPEGSVGALRKEGQLLFVVQKHAASHLHYDFRLEMEGVLKSWAVPKGFPTQRGDRRLAVQVEDHPMDYADFEGTIPQGNYGGGTVMVWDMGTYELLGGTPLGALKSGKLHLALRGKKLKGEWTLVLMRGRGTEEKPQWLLLKSGESIPPFPAKVDDQSCLSGRTMQQIADKNDRQWQSNRSSPDTARPEPLQRSRSDRRAPGRSTATLRAPVSEPPKATRPEVNLARLPKHAAQFVEPMKAMLVERLPKGPDWIYELKFDGVRALGIKAKRSVQLISRAGNDLATRYSLVAESLALLPAKEVILDGEVVALDPQGRSSFQLLQSYHMAGPQKPPLVFYVFDVLQMDGKDLRGLSLLQRKAVAEALLAKAPAALRFSPAIKADSDRLVKELQSRGLEGLIAKKKESQYESGRRSGAWVKYKWTNEQEFVIGGYTPPQGARSHFGALLVGYYEGKKLLFAGKVGTGFNEKTLSALYKRFQPIVIPECPFANLPEKIPDARGKGLTASQMRRCTWVTPSMVCQIRFAEWTRDNHLRQPAFLGLREDKRPSEVVRERPKV